MKRAILFIFTIFSLSSGLSQEIALTFDDAPLPDGAKFTGMQRTSRIIFVVTCQLNGEGLQRLKMYSDAGHLLANHSHSHNWINAMGTANYIRDIRKADSILKATKLPYYFGYRYPFLDEGSTKSARDSIRAALSALSLKNAYVTIDNYDWHINSAMAKAISGDKKINYNKLRKVYLEHVWKSILFYDDIARRVIGRSPKHVLLLHENDLAALFLGDLIQLLKDKGWKIISPEEAYTDPIAEEAPDVLFNGQGRVGAIGFANGLPPNSLSQKSEDEIYLDQLMAENKVFE